MKSSFRRTSREMPSWLREYGGGVYEAKDVDIETTSYTGSLLIYNDGGYYSWKFTPDTYVAEGEGFMSPEEALEDIENTFGINFI